MKTAVAPALATLLLFLAMACQQSDQDIGQLVDERIAAALAVVPTITPQPTATPQPLQVETLETASVEGFEDTIASLMRRLAKAESELLVQNEEFQGFVIGLDAPSETVGIPTDPLAESTVTIAEESTTPAGRCWPFRVVSDGTGNTFLVEWEVLGISNALCHHPSSTCAKEVTIGAPLPRPCAG